MSIQTRTLTLPQSRRVLTFELERKAVKRFNLRVRGDGTVHSSATKTHSLLLSNRERRSRTSSSSQKYPKSFVLISLISLLSVIFASLIKISNLHFFIKINWKNSELFNYFQSSSSPNSLISPQAESQKPATKSLRTQMVQIRQYHPKAILR